MDEQPKSPDTPVMDQKQKDELILHLRILEDLINSMLRLRAIAIAVVVLVLLLGAGFVGATVWFHNTAKSLKAEMESVRTGTKEVKDGLDNLDLKQSNLRDHVSGSYTLSQASSREITRLHGLLDQMKADASDKELQHFQGTWTPVKLVDAEGKPYADMKAYKLSVKGDQSTFENAKKEKSEGTYRLNPYRRPRGIDIVVTTGPDKDKTYVGVYEISGDTLRIAHDPKGENRPDKVEPGTGYVYEEWKRVK